MTPEVLFCLKYLSEHGIDSSNFDEKKSLLDKYSVPEYDLVKREKDEFFFTSLAKSLRELWPPGEKDGKYPWRESVNNLADRLKMLWKFRGLGDYSLGACLRVARRYVAQYENDTRYMQTLKYFVMKQKSVVDPRDGKITYTQTSQFADMLEGQDDIDAVQNEWENILESVSVGEGELV